MDKKESRLSILLGAAFLMATSAIGPGFLTQTTVFTETLLASMGFVILVSIIIDLGAQVNIWRIIAVSKMRAQDIANELLPGLGYFLAAMIVLGGLAFNIGNIAGAGLGLNVIVGVDPRLGAVLSGFVAVGIFFIKEAGKAMDRFAQIMGFVMIFLTLYVMFTASPPVGEAAARTFMPEEIDLLAIVTLVGGTVGGYITFAGGHRLIDAGVSGKENVSEVTKGAVSAIGLASIMRIFLFLSVLGVVSQGLVLDAENPAASVFQHAAGDIGYKIFGIIMWAAAVTSVIGAAYTSVSFIKTFSSTVSRNQNGVTISFIVISTGVFALTGQPVKVLVLAGALNGLILPIALGVMLIASYQKRIVGDYQQPIWMTFLGGIVVAAMSVMGIYTLIKELPRLFV